MICKILERITPQEWSAFIKQADKQRSTPLHCAAYFNCFSKKKMLLEVDRSIAYMKDTKGMTALHIAVHQGHDMVMQYILNYCPDCCELVDERGWNALRFAINSSATWAEDTVKLILKRSSLSNLLNETTLVGIHLSITITNHCFIWRLSCVNKELIRWPSTTKT